MFINEAEAVVLVAVAVVERRGGIEMKMELVKGTREEKRLETKRHLVRELASCNLLKMKRIRESGR